MHRVIELETVDLGLSPEGEVMNNRSARDRTNVHQRDKPKHPFVPVFKPRSARSEASAMEAEEDEEEVEEEQDNEEEAPTVQADSSSGPPLGKRRRILFRTGSEAENGVEKDVAGADTVNKGVDAGLAEVYNQNDLSDEKFLSLQNRIKNRPVSSVNGTYEMHISRPLTGMKGHTAFLTFAVCPLQR
jgi:hypothetical protein